MAMRHTRFNMNELAKRAAEAAGDAHTQCVQVEKFSDGMFNKSFLFTMQDGTQVVGKAPNPNAGLAHYTTASEVATMDFVRNRLGTPAPKVLAWSSKAKENPVGAEYIIMEKIAGVQLEEIWPKLDIKDRLEVVKAISGYQKSWMSTSFAQYGSLYYSSDIFENSEGCSLIGENESETREPRFAVGPSTGREFLDDGRMELNFDRGPRSSAEQYKTAIGLRELICVQEITKLPQSSISLYGPGTYYPSRSQKVAALNTYPRMLKFLLPTDTSISSSFLWHPDLHAENIFVTPERPWQVLGIIDWQSSELLPLFDHARQPYLLDHDGPPISGIDPPAFPQNYDQLDSAEQDKAQSLYLKMSLAALYRRYTYTTNERLYKAMEFRETTSFDMMLLAQNLLIDGEALYQSRVLDLEGEWSSLPGVQAYGNPPFPVQLSADEAASIEQDVSGSIKGMELMRDLRKLLGEAWPEKGVVPHDQYDQAKALLKQAKMETIGRMAHSEDERVAWSKSWPFDD
ncbi:hypothetical protein L228DRAFT_208790 [Xylona heveae TC161]|uniref:Uncharacterized protein n=1 Tax=Xylona heveae (strain CBS 132557 / TC161) TaxID=1328760 RepID=A0A165HUY7_XYLHT|nr:hypothetical protein L228DRAFT_208790 [Xylona heveae TC161]KZF23958.1 hypothetical protein L228DRAFT_208790 [Xylona heveae TC161]